MRTNHRASAADTSLNITVLGRHIRPPARSDARVPRIPLGRLGRFYQHWAPAFPRYAPMASHPRRAGAAPTAPFLRAAGRSGVVGRLLPKWVAEMDAKLHAKHPELFDGSREAMLEVVPIRGSGLGVFVRRNVSIPKDTILGAYGGNIGACLGADDWTVEMPLVRHKRRAYRLAVSAAREARRGTDPVQAGLYNHACQGTTLRGEWFRCGPLSCLLFKARGRLSGGTWNYDGGRNKGAFTLSRAEAAVRPDARPCRCAGSDACPAGRFF